jgi:Family of unknown function (DUF6345)
MFSDHRSRKPFIVTIGLSVLVLLLVLGTQFAFTNIADSAVARGAEPVSRTMGDDFIRDLGLEWVNDTRGTQWDVNYNDDACNGLYSELSDHGWGLRFVYSDESVFEVDFKEEINGGIEDTVVDSVDIAMVCTHSIVSYDPYWDTNLDALFFASQVDDNYLTPSEAIMAYGDEDLEWLAFDSSFILSDESKGNWALSMNGLHLLLGFENYRLGNYISEGELWGRFMTGFYFCSPSNTVMQSWFHTVDYLQPEGTCARVISHGYDTFNDYLHGQGYVNPDPNPYTPKYYFDHCSTGPDSKELLRSFNQPEVLSMSVVQVADRTVDENYVVNLVAPAFGLEDEEPCFDDRFYAVSSISGGITRTLQVDKVTGSYSFQNQSILWTTPIITPTLPSATEAGLLIDTWFRTTPAGNLPGAGYRNAGYEYRTEDIVGMNLPPGENGILQRQEANRLPADVAMTYPRILSVFAGTTNGMQQVNFPVFGPGGRLNIYLGDGGEIIGAQGGSRDVQVMVDQVNILDSNLVWSMFLADHSLAIGEISFMADTITHTIPVLGYYEMPYLVHQNELIPVWMFKANFYAEGNLLGENVPVYLPAATEYLPPTVAILNPPDGAAFWTGEPITFEGSITGGTPPYTIEWSSSNDGYLGNTINLISSLTSPIRASTLYTQNISFQVTDDNGLPSAATISLLIKPIFWLPLINR